MYNRRISSEDDLGLPDALNEYDKSSKPISTHNTYYLAFANNRKTAFDIIFEHTI